MKRPFKWGTRCGVVGFGIATVLAALVYAFHALGVHYELDMLCLMLWPASLGLMATEGASVTHQVLIVLALSIMNGIMYFTLGFLAALLPKSQGPEEV
jgi:hypothetical protein